MSNVNVLKGTVKWVNEFKTFGFIKVEGEAKDCFVHESNVSGEIKRDFKEGILVEFETETSDKGLRAINVKERT